MKRISIMIMLLACYTSNAFSQKIGVNTAQFLKLAPNARPAGMGNAFTGLADDVYAIYWNPGGLGFLQRYELGISGQKLFGGLLHFSAMGIHTRPMLRSERVAFGLGLIYLGASEAIQSTENQKQAAVNGISNYALIVPLGYRLDPISENFSVGLNYKLVRATLANFSATGHGLDLGALWQLAISDDYELSLGAVLQNITLVPMKFEHIPENLPASARAGAALKILLGEQHLVNLVYDAVKPLDNTLKHHFGFEYLWRFSAVHKLALRGGYRVNDHDLGDFTFSLGYGLNLMQVDYAFNNYDPNVLGSANLAGFSLRSSSLEPFLRLLPKHNTELAQKEIVELTWEQAEDEISPFLNYLVVLDTDAEKVLQWADKGRVRKTLREAEKNPKLLDPAELSRHLNVLHAQIVHNARRSSFVDTNTVTKQFHWAVIAANNRYQMQIAGPQNFGSFKNAKAPDFLPLTLAHEPYDRLDESASQGRLTGAVRTFGFNAKLYHVKIFDDSEGGRLIGAAEIRPNPKVRSQMDSFAVAWQTSSRISTHNLRVVADADQQQPELDESNNVLRAAVASIPKGFVQTPDTIWVELRDYESIELPTLVYVFFEPKRAEFSRNAVKHNDELHPDSLLALLAQRLRSNYPRLDITVQGFYSPRSESEIVNGRALAREREQRVIDKLVAFGVHADQILPIDPAKYKESKPLAYSYSPNVEASEPAMVEEENRRVEIRVSRAYKTAESLENEKLLFRPKHIALLESEKISHQVFFSPRLASGREIARLRLEVRANPDDPFPIFVEEVRSPALVADSLMVWNCRIGTGNGNPLVAFNREYSFHLVLTDTAGQTYVSAPRRFHLAKSASVIERRIFALAEFDKATPLHEFYLKYLEDVENTLRENPHLRVRLTGHTDAIGKADYNGWLSARRAAELAKSLSEIVRQDVRIDKSQMEDLLARIETPVEFDKQDTVTWQKHGAGEHAPLAASGRIFGDNSRPQGRLLNRRIEIELVDRTQRRGEVALPIVQQLVFPAEMLRTGISNDIAAVAFEDSIIWLGTARGLIKWLPKQNQFTPLLPPGRTAPQVTCLLVDSRKKTLWVGTTSGLYAVQRDTSWTFYEAGPQSLTGSRVNDLQLDDPARAGLLIATNEGIQAFDGKTFSQIGAPAAGLEERYVNRLYRDDDGKLWACTRRGVYSQSGARWQLYQPEAEGTDGLAFDEVRSMLIDKAGRFWFATSRGVRLLANQRWHNFDLTHGLPSLNVTDLHGDDLGRIWCATDRGIALLESSTEMKEPSDLLWLAFDNNTGLVSDSVTHLLVDANKRLYICTRGGLNVVSATAALHGGN